MSPGLSMDRMYRHQRHIYDFTRKHYLLGRDRMLSELAPPHGGSLLEIGCGTGRNLVRAARLYPGTHIFGVDVSRVMLDTAQIAITRAGLDDRIHLAHADATRFDPRDHFKQARFDRIFVSYSLSMIPHWQAVLQNSAGLLGPGGSLHVVDFGDGAGLPRWFRKALHTWLQWFDVTPRGDLAEEIARAARERGLVHQFEPLHRGYAALARIG
jgi:S-adenosylmethionine-diacylgycerolhomoserine-N-methlytransferase